MTFPFCDEGHWVRATSQRIRSEVRAMVAGHFSVLWPAFPTLQKELIEPEELKPSTPDPLESASSFLIRDELALDIRVCLPDRNGRGVLDGALVPPNRGVLTPQKSLRAFPALIIATLWTG
jgi:hypothetical protein